MPRFPSRAARELVQWAEQYGWRFDGYANNGHINLVHRDGHRYQTAATPSEYRGLKNTKAALLRITGDKEDKPNARRPRGQRRTRGYSAGYTPDYSSAPWRTAQDELEDVDGQLSVLDPRRDAAKVRRLAARRLSLAEELRRYHKPVPPPPIAGL